MLNNFWKRIGLGNSGIWQKTKWIIISIIFFFPNIVFYYTCRLGEFVEKIWFEKYMPAIFRWIKK